MKSEIERIEKLEKDITQIKAETTDMFTQIGRILDYNHASKIYDATLVKRITEGFDQSVSARTLKMIYNLICIFCFLFFLNLFL